MDMIEHLTDALYYTNGLDTAMIKAAMARTITDVQRAS